MSQNLLPCIPTTLHIDQRRPMNVDSDVTRNNFGARYEFRHKNLIWAIFSLKLT